jgi:hypothetical protein
MTFVRKIPLITRKVRYINIHDRINGGDSDAALSLGKTVELQGENIDHIFLRLKSYVADKHGEEVGCAQFLNEQNEWEYFWE